MNYLQIISPILLMLTLVSGCLDESSSRAGRPLIAKISTEEPTPTPTPTATPFARPDGAVFIDGTFCSCIDGEPDIINNCDAFCEDSDTNGKAILTVTATLGAEISEDETFGTLYNWCTVAVDDEASQSASCQLEVSDGIATSRLTLTTLSSLSNAFTVDISSLSKNKTYVAKLVELTSGAASDEFQFMRITPKDPADYMEGPLEIMPVNQYECYNRAITINGTTGAITYNYLASSHYYFPSVELPPVIPPNQPTLLCHDDSVSGQGKNDSSLYPRLKLIEGHVSLWDKTDPRLADANPSNSKLDINEIIGKVLLNDYGIDDGTGQQIYLVIFDAFKYKTYPLTESDKVPIIGYYMKPWIDNTTGKAYCLTQANYNSNIPLFNVLKDFVGIDTEALYLAEKEREILEDDTLAPQDIMLISETDLKRVWFYMVDGLKYPGDEVEATRKTMMFYWPLDFVHPLEAKSDSKLFVVKTPEELGLSSTNVGTIPTTVRPKDKRLGCIPKKQQ